MAKAKRNSIQTSSVDQPIDVGLEISAIQAEHALPPHPAPGALVSRRSIMNMLVAASSVTVATTMPVHAERDPIFAAIDAHHLAWAELSANCSALDEADTEESERELERLNTAVNEAEDKLVDIVPTTLAGVVALLNYAADHAVGGNMWPAGYQDMHPKTGWDREHGVSWEVLLHRNLAKALPKIAA
jgi:hypothetical protein